MSTNKINLYQYQSEYLGNSIDDIIIKLMQKRRSNNVKTLLFCGTEPTVGTTTITINLSISLAQDNNKILLIDSDMRKLAKHKKHGDAPLFGLSDFLSEKVSLGEIINKTNIDNLDYVTGGSSTGQSATLLCSPGLDKLISSFSETYDFILFDSPSLGTVNDGALLSMLIDGIFLIVELGKTTKSSINRAVQNLAESHDKILGVLINKVAPPEYRVYMRNYDYFQNRKYIH